MLLRSVCRAASFVIDPHCTIDFRQSTVRDNNVAIAKARVEKLTQEYQSRAWGSAARPNSADEVVTSMELTHLIDTLVSANERELLAAAVRLAREQSGVTLKPWHLNQLQRSATFARDKAGADHVLRAIIGEIPLDADKPETTTYEGTLLESADRRHMSRCVANLETLGTVITGLHHFGVKNRLQLIIQSFEIMIENNVALAEPYDTRRGTDAENEDSDVDSAKRSPTGAPYVSPVLSSLLHAVACGCEGPVPALLVAFFIRLVGAELSIWDYIHVQLSLIRDSDHFPHVRDLFSGASSSDSSGDGVGDVAANTHQSPLPSCSLNKLLAAVRKWCNEEKARLGTTASNRVASQRHIAVEAIANLIDQWWKREGQKQLNSEDCTVYVGFIGVPFSTLESLLELMDREATRRKYVGPACDSAVKIFHARGLMHQSMSNRISSVKELTKINNHRAEWLRRYADSGSEYLASLQLHHPYANASTSSPSLRVRQGMPTESFQTVMAKPTDEFTTADLLAVKDLSNFLPEVPSSVRSAAAEPFNAMMQRANHANALALGESRILWALSIPLVRDDAEAQAAIDYIHSNSVHFRQIFKAVKTMIRSLILTASLHPPRNMKMTPEAAIERRRWGVYCEARDIALTMTGQCRQGRELMKSLYLNANRFGAIRSLESIRADVDAMSRLFDVAAAASGRDESSAPSSSSSIYPASKVLGTSWLDEELVRMTQPIFPSRMDVIPVHLYDPAVPNMYPHIALKISKNDESLRDIFPAVQRLLASQGDQWWLNESNTFVELLRCHIHRLDWTGAVKLSESAFKNFPLTSAIDAEIQRMFAEIGDPLGALPFKAAAKIVDLRIKEKSASGSDVQ